MSKVRLLSIRDAMDGERMKVDRVAGQKYVDLLNAQCAYHRPLATVRSVPFENVTTLFLHLPLPTGKTRY